jgi:hypothetical protein
MLADSFIVVGMHVSLSLIYKKDGASKELIARDCTGFVWRHGV